MHYAFVARRARKARREAEELFKSLRTPGLYPTRFRFGETAVFYLLIRCRNFYPIGK